MRGFGKLALLVAGVAVGSLATFCWFGVAPKTLAAGTNDRFEDYVMVTGAVAVGNGRSPTEGVWLLDYRSGKLLGTVIDRSGGKVIGFAEVDMVSEFELPPRTNAHFLLTTGNIALGQAALYVAETTSGKFGVYTMGPAANGGPGIQIRRHDLTNFRKFTPGG